MKRFVLRSLGLAVLGLLCASASFATDGITLDPNFPADYATYTFVDSMGNSQTVFASPFVATETINGVSKSFYLSCLDLHLPTDVGTFYSGTFAAPVGTDQEEIAWLTTRLEKSTNTSPIGYIGPISMAIYEIGGNTSNGGPVGFSDPAAAKWILAAQNAVANGYTGANQLIFTPDDGGSQRFGVIPNVPEPGSLLMLGSGILGFAGILRRKLINN